MAVDTFQREILPIPGRTYPGLISYEATEPDAKFPAIRPLLPPAGAPNVLVVLLDDVAFRASSAFGGPVHPPTVERLAGQGLEYTRLDTIAICSPTRAALITGRNHHSVGMGGITEMATAAPGYTSVRPNTSTMAEILKLMPPRISASATRFRCGRAVRPGRSTAGPTPATVSNTSTGFWAARPVVPDPARRHHTAGAVGHAGRGLPPHRGSDRQGDRLGAPAMGADARPAARMAQPIDTGTSHLGFRCIVRA
jgi:hypothetical protein